MSAPAAPLAAANSSAAATAPATPRISIFTSLQLRIEGAAVRGTRLSSHAASSAAHLNSPEACRVTERSMQRVVWEKLTHDAEKPG